MRPDFEPWLLYVGFICMLLGLIARYYAGREEGLPVAANWQLWLTIAVVTLAILFFGHVLDVWQERLFSD